MLCLCDKDSLASKLSHDSHFSEWVGGTWFDVALLIWEMASCNVSVDYVWHERE